MSELRAVPTWAGPPSGAVAVRIEEIAGSIGAWTLTPSLARVWITGHETVHNVIRSSAVFEVGFEDSDLGHTELRLALSPVRSYFEVVRLVGDTKPPPVSIEVRVGDYRKETEGARMSVEVDDVGPRRRVRASFHWPSGEWLSLALSYEPL